MALTLLIVLNVIFWTIELCSLVYTYTVLAGAANEGIRYAIVDHTLTCDDISAKVKNYAQYSLHDISAITVTPAGCGGTPPAVVSVQVSYTYIPYITFIGLKPPTLTTYAEGRYVN